MSFPKFVSFRRRLHYVVLSYALVLLPVGTLVWLQTVGESLGVRGFLVYCLPAVFLAGHYGNQYTLKFSSQGIDRKFRSTLFWRDCTHVEGRAGYVRLRTRSTSCHIDLMQFAEPEKVRRFIYESLPSGISKAR